MRGFEPAEFAARAERAQVMMNAAGLSALLLTTETDVRYFTGYLTRFWESPTRPWFLILPAVGKPVAVILDRRLVDGANLDRRHPNMELTRPSG